MSFVSTAGLIYLVPIFQLALPWVPESVQDATLVTLAAILSTLPLILGTFGSVSVVAPVVNFLVLPVVGIVMAGGLVMVLVPWFLGPVLKLISMLVWVPLEFFVSVVEVFAGIPFASITLDSPLKWIVPVGYTVILLLLLKYYPGSSESILIKDLRV